MEVGQSIGIQGTLIGAAGSEGGPMVFSHMGNKTGSESASAESRNHILETTAATDKIASSVTIKRFVFDKEQRIFTIKSVRDVSGIVLLFHHTHLFRSSSCILFNGGSRAFSWKK